MSRKIQVDFLEKRNRFEMGAERRQRRIVKPALFYIQDPARSDDVGDAARIRSMSSSDFVVFGGYQGVVGVAGKKKTLPFPIHV